MPKIILKWRLSDSAAPSKAILLRVLHDNQVNVSSLRLLNNSYHVHCNNDHDSDRLFSETCVAALLSVGCEPILPPEVRAKRTVLLRNLDDLVHEHECNDIREAIDKANDNFDVADIYKFPASKMLKITFKTQEMASHCLENGIYMFNLRVPPRNIIADQYIDVKVCYRCYKLDDHISSACDKDDDYVICSLCSSMGHNFKNCSVDVKRCINCHEPHNTLAMSCPMRKKIVDSRRRESRRTYASTTANNERVQSNNARPILIEQTNAPINPALISDVKEVVNRSTLCLLVATMKERETRGCFQAVLNKLLLSNGLSTFSMGDVNPPILSDLCSDLFESNEGSRDTVVSDETLNHLLVPRTDVDEVSSQLEESVNNPSIHDTPSKSINIFKKRGQIKLTPDNFTKLIADQKIIVESSLSISDCVKLLKADFGVANILEIPVAQFNKKLNDTSVGRRVNAVARNNPLVK